jgi:hypothetical protein
MSGGIDQVISLNMERMCSQCHAVMGEEMQGDWCPACGGALVERKHLSEGPLHAVAEVDHRGIVLPRRHALGGIITPQ